MTEWGKKSSSQTFVIEVIILLFANSVSFFFTKHIVLTP